MAKDVLEDSILPRACISVHRSKQDHFVLHEFSNRLSPKEDIPSASPLPFHSIKLGLNTSLIIAMTRPKFTFYKVVTTTCKNGNPLYILEYVCT